MSHSSHGGSGHDHGAPGHAGHGHGDRGHGDRGHGDRGHEEHGHGGAKKYLCVFLALCVLSTASFITTSDMWPFSRHVAWAFMMAVSCGKAMLVVLFFMHVKYEANWKYVLTIPCSIMAVFLTLALVPDVGHRQESYSDSRKKFAAEPEVSHDDATPKLRERGH